LSTEQTILIDEGNSLTAWGDSYGQ